MKKNILLISPLLLLLLAVFTSCCKEDICTDKLAGNYKCSVIEYIDISPGNYSYSNTTIVQKVRIASDSTLLFNVTVDNKCTAK